MGTRPLVAAAMTAVFVVVGGVGQSVAGDGFATPEDAVREYLEGVAQADIERILRASAADELEHGYRFDLMVDRLQSYQPHVAGPVHDPFFAEIQRAGWAVQLLGQARTLRYSLLLPDDLSDVADFQPIYEVDAAWARDFIEELDPARLSSLVVADIRLPTPERYKSARNLANVARTASIYGADEMTDRVALIVHNGQSYAVGFQLLRYGGQWSVFSQSSPISGTQPMGSAMPMTPTEYEELTSP